MACSRGAASPDAHTQRRLFAASAGYCQNPNCANELFRDAAGEPFHIAEMAHVFAANDNGPRAKPDLSLVERGAFENLIVLCANCHTMVDKAPKAFPDEMMLGWKREHANRLQDLFGAVRFGDRTAARQVDFDVIVKSSSYGSITPQAGTAAESIGAQALTFAELMQQLSK